MQVTLSEDDESARVLRNAVVNIPPYRSEKLHFGSRNTKPTHVSPAPAALGQGCLILEFNGVFRGGGVQIHCALESSVCGSDSFGPFWIRMPLRFQENGSFLFSLFIWMFRLQHEPPQRTSKDATS